MVILAIRALANFSKPNLQSVDHLTLLTYRTVGTLVWP